MYSIYCTYTIMWLIQVEKRSSKHYHFSRKTRFTVLVLSSLTIYHGFSLMFSLMRTASPTNQPQGCVSKARLIERMQQDPDMMHEIGLPSGHPPESTADKQASMPRACPFARLNVVGQSHRSNTHTKCLIDAVGGVAVLKRSTKPRFYQKAFAASQPPSY